MTKSYPIVEVTQEIDGQLYLMNIGVVETLPAEVILGRDLPILNELLQEYVKSEQPK